MNTQTISDADIMERAILPIIRKHGCANADVILKAIGPIFQIMNKWPVGVREPALEALEAILAETHKMADEP